MKYDFKNYLNRVETGSSKWLDMCGRNPNVKEGVLPLSVMDMDFLTCPKINDALVNYINTQTLGYSRPVDSYLESVVNFFKDHHGYEGKKEWIITTPGIVSALATAVGAFTEKGDNVIVFTPVYHPFFDVIESQERNIVSCPLKYENNRYELDFELFEKTIVESKAKLVLFCSPHNPGGIVWSKEDLLKVADIVEKYELLIVSDEIHSDIVYEGNKHYLLGSVNNSIGKRAIVCTAASKTFNIAGLQCSNIFIENEEIRNKFRNFNNGIGIERANVLGMVATKAAYDNCLDWLDELKEVIQENYKVVEDFFCNYGNIFSVMKTEASFAIWINFENLNVKHEDFMTFLDNDAEFFVTNGIFFGENGRGIIRINVGLPKDKLVESFDRLKIALKNKYNI